MAVDKMQLGIGYLVFGIGESELGVPLAKWLWRTEVVWNLIKYASGVEVLAHVVMLVTTEPV